MQKLFKIFLILCVSTLVHAHVGSADVYYEGNAGPYPLFVTVRMPQVIPGIAELQVRSASPDVESMKVVLLRLSGPGSNLPSVPDLAQRSKDDPQFFVSKLWIMEYGALQVRLQVNGSKGTADLSVPVASFARQSLPMNIGLRLLAIFFLIALTFSLVPIIGGVVRDTSVTPGEVTPVANRRRSRIVMVFVMIAVTGILYLNRAWWQNEADTYQRAVDLLKPPKAETKLVDGNRLLIRPAEKLKVPFAGMERLTTEVKMEDVIPDHGHLMHLFLIKLPGMDRMWHLHPERIEGGSFAERLPAMPAGKYQLFADIVDKNGYPWTMVGNLELPQIAGTPLQGDDSGWEGDGLTTPVAESNVAQLPDGARIIWERGNGPLRANVPASFKFRVEEKDGSPARGLQPYMGMAAHAEVVCSDLSVFAHIHPNGSVAMASLDLAQAGLVPQSLTGSRPMEMDMNMTHSFSALPSDFDFPYGFPHPGDYRMFVQIKRLDNVQTAVFNVHVQ